MIFFFALSFLNWYDVISTFSTFKNGTFLTQFRWDSNRTDNLETGFIQISTCLERIWQNAWDIHSSMNRVWFCDPKPEYPYPHCIRMYLILLLYIFHVFIILNQPLAFRTTIIKCRNKLKHSKFSAPWNKTVHVN